MALQIADRVATKLRIALTGPTNAGKTYSGLRLAFGIAKFLNPDLPDEEIWKQRIAVGDTERGRARMYVNRKDLPLPTGQFLYQQIRAPYDPEKAIAFLKEAEKAVGPNGVVFLDSTSHFWSYKGGVLDIKEQIAKQAGKNSYTAWNEAGAIQNEWLDVLLSLDCHVIVTIRSKMDYVLEQDEKGRAVPVKKGLAPIQRDDMEYEFDITLMLDKDHIARVIKDTTFLNQIGFEGMLTEQLGSQLVEWMEQGTDPKEFQEEERLALISQIKALAKKHKPLATFYRDMYPNTKSDELTLEQAEEVLEKFREVL